MVKRFSSSEATVVIWDNDKELLDNLNLDEKVSSIVTDVTSYDSVVSSTNETLSKHKKIYFLTA